MREKIVRSVFIILVVILAIVLFCRWADKDVVVEPKTDQNAKYEPTDIQKAEVITTLMNCVIEEVPAKTFEPVVMESEPVVEQDAEIVEYPKLYTEDDVIAMAKLLYGEARGVRDLYIWDGRVRSSEYQKACVIWCVLNRYDAGWGNSIVEVVSAYKQFHGYDEEHPVEEDLVILAYDVLERWNREQHGETEVGRVLPAEYIYFYGDMKNNYFLEEYKDRDEYNWDLEDPYM